MSDRLPRVTAADAIRALERAGFSFHGQLAATRYTRIRKARGQLYLIILERFSTQKF